MGESDSSILLMILFIVLEGLVSCMNAAIHTVNESNVRKKAAEGDKKSAALLKMIDTPESYMNAVEFLLTGAIALTGFYAAELLYADILRSTASLFQNSGGVIVRYLITAAIWIIIVFLVTLFGRVLPKKIGSKFSEPVSYHTASVIRLLAALLKPLSVTMNGCTYIILRIFGLKPVDFEENMTEDEIRSIVNEGQEQGVIEANEAEMISNIMELDTIEVQDIMTHRKKIIGINAALSIEEAVRFMSEERYSRFPLYEDDIDNIIGIIHLKDATRYYISNQDREKPLSEIARDPYFVPDTQRIDVLFNDMQLKKIHMAIAIDEYGQTAGLVAMEDILEEIVGNIFDEYDEEEKFIVDQGKGKYLIKGLASLEDIEDKLGIEFEQDDYDTLNGFLISILDRIPADGEKATVVYKGYQFQIMYVKDKMIRYVKVYPEHKED